MAVDTADDVSPRCVVADAETIAAAVDEARTPARRDTEDDDADTAEAEDEADRLRRTLANEGLADWFASLPADDWTDALDEAAFVSVKWVEGSGFVQVPS